MDTPRRLFLEQRGEAHHHGPKGIIQTRTWQVMIDLADEWPTVTGPQDLLDRLKPQREIHDRRYDEEHKGAPRYGWQSPDRTIWSDHILWRPPQIVSYHLPSSKREVAA